ncbi:MAG: BLUF domain-containing protein [Bacteroidia bacterium]
MELTYLIYKSKPTANLSEKDLLEIAEQSKNNNIDNGLTGLLIFGNNEFIQVLEGSEKDIEALYQKLLSDKRHNDVIIVKRGELERRYFPTWSMGFRAVSVDEMQLIDKAIEEKPINVVTGYVALEMIEGFIKRLSIK